MSDHRLLYFAVGVLSVVAVGQAMAIRDDGLQFPDGSIQTTAAAGGAAGLERAYLTAAKVQGNQTKTACASGYHTASISEITNIDGREYAADATGALSTADRGEGFVLSTPGWIRTGGVAENDWNNPFPLNCLAWDSAIGYGFTASAGSDGVSYDSFNVTTEFQCSTPNHVWCVED